MFSSEIFKSYIPLLEYMSKTFGKNCEAILYDIDLPYPVVVAVYNNVVTGQHVGESAPYIIQNIVAENSGAACNFLPGNMMQIEMNNKLIRCSNYFIKDTAGKSVGLICLNIDLTALKAVTDELHSFFELSQPSFLSEEAAEKKNNSTNALEEMMLNLISETIESSQKRPSVMSIEEKKHFVGQLHSKGVSLLKGSVNVVADIMEVSDQTVYRYLKEFVTI